VKLLVIGIGKCGSALAGELSELNKRARSERHVQIIAGAYAVDNDKERLPEIRSKYRDVQTILLGRSLDGVSSSAEAGAEIMREEGGRVLTLIKSSDFYNTDAVLLIAASAGNLGSGGISVLASQLKDRHIGKPIYTLVVLPFESEAEKTESIYNTALCLNSLQRVADAVILFDNEKFRRQAAGPGSNDTNSISKEMAFPFYDLLCASEQVDVKLAGARRLGIGDMLQTLKGWSSVGYGQTDFPMSKSFWKTSQNFQEKGSETQKAQQAMSLAVGQLSVNLKLEDAGKALYLLSIPAEGANMDMVKVVGNRLMELTNNAEIRGGDFYGARDSAQVTLILSDLTYIEDVKGYFDKAIVLTRALRERRKIS
jgi:cell division GTPase FtsZ